MFKIIRNKSKKGNTYTALVFIAEDDSVIYVSFDNRVIADLAIKNGFYNLLSSLSVGGEIVI